MRTMVSEISRTSKELLEFFTANDMQQEENRKDLLAAIRESAKKEKTPKSEKKSKGSAKGAGGLLGILAFAAGLIGGTVVGFVGEVAALFGSLLKDTKWFKSIADGISKIKSIFVGLGETISVAINGNKYLSGMQKIIQVISKTIAPFFSSIRGFFGFLGQIFGSIGNGFKLGIKFGSGIAKIFGSILKVIGPLLRVVALPLTIIMGLIGTITGAIKGFKEGGIIGGIKGAIVGLFDSLIGSILDMIKGAISWIAGALGFKDVEKALDSFSFTGLFKDFIDAMFGIAGEFANFISAGAASFGKYLKQFSVNTIFKFFYKTIDKVVNVIVNFLKNIPTFISKVIRKAGAMFTGAIKSLGSIAADFAKGILKNILPDPAKHRSWIDPLTYVTRIIPDDVYKFAGILPAREENEPASPQEPFVIPQGYSPEGGEEIPQKTSSINKSVVPFPNTTGAELNMVGKGYASNTAMIINNNYGGNTTTNTTSSINNTQSNYDPIMPGSAMGFASI